MNNDIYNQLYYKHGVIQNTYLNLSKNIDSHISCN